MIGRPDGKPCHDGQIEVVQFHPDTGRILTAGKDGFVRVWDATQINDCEGEGDSIYGVVEPLEEVKIAEGARLKSLEVDHKADTWILLDEAGVIYRAVPGMTAGSYDVRRVFEFHSGGISEVLTLSRAHLAITAGLDGSLRRVQHDACSSAYCCRFCCCCSCSCSCFCFRLLLLLLVVSR